MQTQRGFIGLAALIAIVLGIVVFGGGAYFVMHQNAAPQQPKTQPTTNVPGVQVTTKTPTRVSNEKNDQPPYGVFCGTISPTQQKGNLQDELERLSIGPVFSCVGSHILNGCSSSYMLTPLTPTSTVEDVYQIHKQNGICTFDTVFKNSPPSSSVVTVSCPLSVFNPGGSTEPPASLTQPPGKYVAAIIVKSTFLFIGLDIASAMPGAKQKQPSIPGCTVTQMGGMNNSQSNQTSKSTSNTALSPGSSSTDESKDPVLLSVSPSSGPQDTQVTITGKDFNASKKYFVYFGNGHGSVPGYYSPDNSTQLTFRIPTALYACPITDLTSVPGGRCEGSEKVQPGLYQIMARPIPFPPDNQLSNTLTFTVTSK